MVQVYEEAVAIIMMLMKSEVKRLASGMLPLSLGQGKEVPQ